MRYASEALREEHEMIRFGLNILEEMAIGLDDAQLVENEDMADMIAFFKQFADSLHHGKEERLYFPALENAGLMQSDDMPGVLQDEHEAVRSSLARMEEALDGNFQPGKLAAAATAYIAQFREHIDKEERLLFQLGDERLPSAEQDALLKAFDRLEDDLLGDGAREKLHEMLACLDRKYPT